MGVVICMKLSCLPCMHVHAHACTCVWGAPPNHPHPPPTLIHQPPTPQSRWETKSPQFNKSQTNQDNSILFEDSLPLNIPQLI